MTQLELQTETQADPYIIFEYSIRSPYTKESYFRRLRRFFDAISLEGPTFESRCNLFAEKGKQDHNWAFSSILKFVLQEKKRVEKKEITAGTLRNSVKTIKTFCEIIDVLIPWKKITRGLPRVKRYAEDRAPTLEEITKIAEYPDRRIKPIVYTMTSSGIRVGAWDYLKWGHIVPINKNGNLGAAKVIVYAGEPDEYFTFITSEAYFALESWMNFRMRSGESVNDESWVMRNLWNTLRPTENSISRKTINEPEKLNSIGVKRLIERALWAQGIRNKLANGKRRHQFQTDHGFRKWFKTQSEISGMKPINVDDNTIKILESHGLITVYVKYRHKYLNAPIVYYEKETKWGGYVTKKYILNMDEVLPVDCFSDQTRGVIQDFIDEYKTPEQYIKENLDFIGNLPEDYKKLIPKWHKQSYYVELWTEKSAMVGTFRSMLEGLDVRIVYNRGFDSISNSWGTYQRIRKAWDQGKKVVILYCGDLDPSGDMMGDMMDETIKDIMNVFFNVERYENDEKYRFKRIAILPEHIERFKLPKNPDKQVLDKLKQDPRKERFKQKYDLKSDNDLFQIEIDALAAFNPEELKQMLRGAILPYREHEIYDKLLKDDKHSHEQISLHIRKNVHKFLEEQNIKSFMEYYF